MLNEKLEVYNSVILAPLRALFAIVESIGPENIRIAQKVDGIYQGFDFIDTRVFVPETRLFTLRSQPVQQNEYETTF